MTTNSNCSHCLHPQIDFPRTRHSYQIRSKVKRNPRTFLGTLILSEGWGFNFNISFVEELDVIKIKNWLCEKNWLIEILQKVVAMNTNYVKSIEQFKNFPCSYCYLKNGCPLEIRLDVTYLKLTYRILQKTSEYLARDEGNIHPDI